MNDESTKFYVFAFFNKSILKIKLDQILSSKIHVVISGIPFSQPNNKLPFCFFPSCCYITENLQLHKMLVSSTDFHFHIKQIRRINIFHQLLKHAIKRKICLEPFFYRKWNFRQISSKIKFRQLNIVLNLDLIPSKSRKRH